MEVAESAAELLQVASARERVREQLAAVARAAAAGCARAARTALAAEDPQIACCSADNVRRAASLGRAASEAAALLQISVGLQDAAACAKDSQLLTGATHFWRATQSTVALSATGDHARLLAAAVARADRLLWELRSRVTQVARRLLREAGWPAEGPDCAGFSWADLLHAVSSSLAALCVLQAAANSLRDPAVPASPDVDHQRLDDGGVVWAVEVRPAAP